MFAKRFSYAIYYEIKNKIAYVVVVLPMRRDPSWIKTKLQQFLKINPAKTTEAHSA